MKYIIHSNREENIMEIICGPLDEKGAREGMKQAVVKRLVELNIVENEMAAEARYNAAEKAKYMYEKDEEPHVRSTYATICYGYDRTDIYHIVDYDG